MITSITISGTLYGIEPNCYDGDILLLSSKQDVCIEGGYDELIADAHKEYGYIDSISGDIECEQYDIDAYIESHIEHYIRENFHKGLVTINN